MGVVKFVLPANATEDQLLYFANELELAVRQHDLIARTSIREFSVLIRLDSDITDAYKCLVARVKNVEKRGFQYTCVCSDGTKELEQLLVELDNPQIYESSKNL